jgi:hypothetical protein
MTTSVTPFSVRSRLVPFTWYVTIPVMSTRVLLGEQEAADVVQIEGCSNHHVHEPGSLR